VGEEKKIKSNGLSLEKNRLAQLWSALLSLFWQSDRDTFQRKLQEVGIDATWSEIKTRTSQVQVTPFLFKKKDPWLLAVWWGKIGEKRRGTSWPEDLNTLLGGATLFLFLNNYWCEVSFPERRRALVSSKKTKLSPGKGRRITVQKN